MKELFKDLKIDLTTEQETLFKTYYEFLISENKKYNLTRITEYKEVLVKHFYDSLTLFKVDIFNDASICDIGAGAGFPSIPLKIINPSIKLTIVESQRKKTNFLNELVQLLNLKEVKIVNDRAESYAEKNLDSYDFVIARAVAPLNILVELTLPLVKVNGSFLAMKGDNYESELELAKNGIITLGGKLIKTINLDLPLHLGKRNIIIIEKTKSIKGYPRHYSQIKKKPL